MLRGRGAIGLAGLATLWFTAATVSAHGTDTCSFNASAASDSASATLLNAQTVIVDTETFILGDGGRNTTGCHTFPDDDLTCSSVLSGSSVYMPDAYLGTDADLADIFAVEARVASILQELEGDLASAGEECRYIFQVYACVSRYPMCDDEEPTKMTFDACEEIHEACAPLFEKYENLITPCDAVVTDAEAQYFFRPDYWLDTEVWQVSATSSSQGFDAQDLEDLAGLVAAAESELNCEYPLVPTMNRVSPGSKTCEYQSKFPVYSDEAWESIRLALVVPGLLSIPFNVFAVFKTTQELRKRPHVYSVRRRRGDKDRRRIVLQLFRLAASFGIIFALVSAVPAAILGFQVGLVSQTQTFVQESAACWISKTAPFFLMSLVNMITTTLIIIWLRVHAAKRMRSYRGSRRERFCVWAFSFLLPAVLCAIALVLDDSRLYEEEDGRLVAFQNMYFVRNTFMCFPRLAHASHELLLIHIPLMLSGVAGFITAVSVAMLLRSERNSCMGILCGNLSFANTSVMYSMPSSASSRSSSGGSDSGGLGISGIGRSLRKPTINTSRKYRTVNRTTDEGISLRITAQTIRLGSLFFIFIVLGFVGVILVAPSLQSFSTSMYQWWDCADASGFYTCMDTLTDSESIYDSEICCGKCGLEGFDAAYPEVCGACEDAPSNEDLFLIPGLASSSSSSSNADDVPPPGQLMLFYFSWSVIPLVFGLSFCLSHLKHILAMRAANDFSCRSSQSTPRTTRVSSGSKGYVSPFRRADSRRDKALGVFDGSGDDMETGFYSVTTMKPQGQSRPQQREKLTPAPPTDSAPPTPPPL
ncbi:Hypothetical Protein FCC1311_045142 [Hondaea fermentalgiana]|uniref:FZ domain-containing protein n=1 Tax=Hondaea fermentalgiana TaxID=2315210 RepID=A0A2R5GJ22_9STRA|nr:Hypothetical Protein FCC1311_045142 [Hondaea fermentalgiana]|eukprot:GBG28291.1 Hypothetical Protein FCC1311_045142 [Hondaea fermentalgiana]